MTRQEIIDRLNYLRSQELFAIQQYMNHYYRVKGANFAEVQGMEKSIALVEMRHAEMLAEKIDMLGGDPINNPTQIEQMKGSRITEGNTPEEMVRADLGLERGAIRDYTQAIYDIGDSDPAVRKMLEDILEQEEDHADSFGSWLGEGRAYEVGELKGAA